MTSESQRNPLQEHFLQLNELNQSKKRYIDILLGTPEDPGEKLHPSFTDTVKVLDKNFPQREELRILGGTIISRRIAEEFRSKFNTEEVKGFTLEQWKKAILQLGMEYYEIESEFPYSNTEVQDEILIAKYTDPIETEDQNPALYHKLPQAIKKRFRGKKPLVTSKVEFVHFPKKPAIIPELVFKLVPPNTATFQIRRVTQFVRVSRGSGSIIDLLLDHFDYKLTPVELSEPVVFVPLTKLVPAKSERDNLTTYGTWNMNKGAWYFKSEIGDFLKD